MTVTTCKTVLGCVALACVMALARSARRPDTPGPPARTKAELAAGAKQLLRARCFECHGGSRDSGGVKVIDHAGLLTTKKVRPGDPDESPLYQAIARQSERPMPPSGQPPLSPDDLDLIRHWIAAGAPAFPADAARPTEEARDRAFKDVAGVDHVLKKVLAHVRSLPPPERRRVRYFSINHILMAGATEAEMDLQREALAKAINHLSWQKEIVRPTAIDKPHNTVFAIDLEKLGWGARPFERWRDGKRLGASSVTLWDLALLEYPYGTFYEGSDTFERLLREYVVPAGLVRPIPYVRADWFVSVVTQPPLYQDLLRLPFEVDELERRLDVDRAGARRAGLTVSGVSRNNRLVQRHASRYGGYWKTFDFRSSKGRENLFDDPIDPKPAGSEALFALPNGLQGYFLADGKGDRIDSAPTSIVTDRFAEDRTVRNGLACMRCHDRGVKSFGDSVRPVLERLTGNPGFDRRLALKLYASRKEMDALLKADRERYLGAMKKVLGKAPAREPLIPVSRRYLDDPLHLNAAAGELGLAKAKELSALFGRPRFTALGLVPLSAQGLVRRDTWEDYHDRVVRLLGLRVPVVPIDGVLRRDFPGGAAPFDVVLKTNRRGNVFEPGDEAVVFVVNQSATAITIELVGTSARGRKVVLTGPGTRVKPGKTYRYPAQGGVKVRSGLGKEQITLLASQDDLPAPLLLRGKDVADRVLHPFYEVRVAGKRLTLSNDAAGVVKKTIEIETR